MKNPNDNKIQLAVVLGSGLGESMTTFPRTRIISEDENGIHQKVVFISNLEQKEVLIFSGRKHLYEGYELAEITANMTLANNMGVRNILLTNAAGGINDNFNIGDLMLINSHINLNQKVSFEKVQFPYSHDLYGKIASICSRESIRLHEGAYCCTSGPAYETKAEIRMLRRFGCDAAGMSTVPETFKAASLKMNVAAVSVITNLLRENNFSPPDHGSIVKSASLASQSLFTIIKMLLNELN